MKTISQRIHEIRELPQNLRLAGYIKRNAALTEHLAKLRLEKEDNEWTDEDEAKWERLEEEVEPWWYALNEEDRRFLRTIEVRMAALANGEDVVNDNPFIVAIGTGI